MSPGYVHVIDRVAIQWVFPFILTTSLVMSPFILTTSLVMSPGYVHAIDRVAIQWVFPLYPYKVMSPLSLERH